MKILDARVVREVTKVQLSIEMTPGDWRLLLRAIDMSGVVEESPAHAVARQFVASVGQNLVEARI